jgi:histidine ammonia-lyase
MDRLSLSCLAARRSAELAQLCKSLLAIELVVAAQAVQMRAAASPLGAGSQRLFEFVRGCVPYAVGSQGVPNPAPLLAALEAREFSLG